MGKHGGINILHQKSWHVWRLDNRLTVERDELAHAEEQRQKQRAEEQTTFSAKIKMLKRRSEGLDDLEPPVEIEAAPGLAGGGATSSTSGVAQSGGQDEKKKKKGKDSKMEASYKYGKYFSSNLKRAEEDLDAMLQGKESTRSAKSYWGTGNLGSGPHINLFEDAEQMHKKQTEEHQKHVGYTERNNDLAGKSKKRTFSEFDECANDIPWYARPSVTEADTNHSDPPSPQKDQTMRIENAKRLEERSRSRSTPRMRLKWSERHGQTVVRLKLPQEQMSKTELDPLKLEDETKPGLAEAVELLGETLQKCKKEKKDKKDKKADKKDRKEEKKQRERQELASLRLKREQREAKERGRTAGLVGALR